MTHIPVVARLFVIACLSMTCAQTLATEQKEVLFGEVNTIRGKLQVLQRFSVAGEGDSQRILLDGQQIVRQVGYLSIEIDAVYPSQSAARLILLALNTGGTGCPSYYKVLEIHEDGQITLTEEFGNCWERAMTLKHPVYKLQENPIYKDGAWRIGLPATVGAAKGKIDWYVYRDGKVTSLDGKSETDHAGDSDWDVKRRFAAAVPNDKEREMLIHKYGGVREAYNAWLADEVKRRTKTDKQ